MAGGHDPACRGAFPADRSAGDLELRAFMAGVVDLRHRHPALRRGLFAPGGADAMAAAYVRTDAEDTFVVALNAGEDAAWLDVQVPDLDGLQLAPVTPAGWPWAPGDAVTVADGRAWLELPARGARVLHARR